MFLVDLYSKREEFWVVLCVELVHHKKYRYLNIVEFLSVSSTIQNNVVHVLKKHLVMLYNMLFDR